jgi:hypothetical protein
MLISSSGRVKPIQERILALFPKRIVCHYTLNPINYDLRNNSTPEFVRLLPFEVLHGGVILKNEEEVLGPMKNSDSQPDFEEYTTNAQTTPYLVH